MIKKHFIACSGMLVLLVMAKLFIYSTPSDYPESSFRFDASQKVSSSSDSLVESLNFANESMPLGDAKVARRIKRELRAHSYAVRQTSMLHANADQWFPVVESILKTYGIPEDFKYIPLVESGLKRGTSSNRGASGYWQFMPGTARTYGLRVDRTVDERQDVRKSTVAACKYLKSLFREFNSWTLVAAAYNIGETNLKRQMDRQRQKNYFKMELNAETASYVYKLISMKEIIENPEAHGYQKPVIPQYFVKADLKLQGKVSPLSDQPTVLRKQVFQN